MYLCSENFCAECNGGVLPKSPLKSPKSPPKSSKSPPKSPPKSPKTPPVISMGDFGNFGGDLGDFGGVFGDFGDFGGDFGKKIHPRDITAILAASAVAAVIDEKLILLQRVCTSLQSTL